LLGALIGILAGILAAFASSQVTYGLVFLLSGISASAFTVSGLSIVLEFPKPDRRPIYVGLVNTLRSPFQVIAPLLGGMLAGAISFRTIFLFGAIVVAIGLILLLPVREPRRVFA